METSLNPEKIEKYKKYHLKKFNLSTGDMFKIEVNNFVVHLLHDVENFLVYYAPFNMFINRFKETKEFKFLTFLGIIYTGEKDFTYYNNFEQNIYLVKILCENKIFYIEINYFRLFLIDKTLKKLQ